MSPGKVAGGEERGQREKRRGKERLTIEYN